MKNKSVITISVVAICSVVFGVWALWPEQTFNGIEQEIKTKPWLQLKAPKENILANKEKTTYGLPLIYDGPKPRLTPYTSIEYDYISDQKATKVPYFNNSIYSNAEILPSGAIAFYSEKYWVKEGDVIYDIKRATTTIEAFNEQTKLTFLESIFPKALAETYTTDGTYTPPSAGTVEILVVGGGGSGGEGGGGGGGAGGYRYNASLAVTVQEYPVTVGDGGTGPDVPSNGEDSIFSTITSTGGGKGGSGSQNGANGGSGGGAGETDKVQVGGAGNTPSTDPVQGYDGGDNQNAPYYCGGGGGGGSELGDDANGIQCGAGGNGTSNSISGSPVVYAGGGGASAVSVGSTHGHGGTGGGGDGAYSALTAEDGEPNTGGGGGGGYDTINDNCGNGGSGIVILVFTAGAGVSGEEFYYVE